ncbi:MAG: hypothetical protein LBB53_06335 [Prevotellaceae bacterium]|jgi:hypothetical protein|nr:hypothetical protein [Prevotellaceae bacterium]
MEKTVKISENHGYLTKDEKHLRSIGATQFFKSKAQVEKLVLFAFHCQHCRNRSFILLT